MMEPVSFVKMNGLGNDFVLIDGLKTSIEPSIDFIQAIANRHSGVGCDQVLWLMASDCDEIDFVYRIFNPDGQEVGQCGNGARCVGYYALLFYPSISMPLKLRTVSGINLLVDVKDQPRVFSATMGLPRPVVSRLGDESLSVLEKVELDGEFFEFQAIDLGNPHMVIYTGKNLAELPLGRWGRLLQEHALFPEGVNIEFVNIIDRSSVHIRVYERGAEETQACASGACAAVVAGILRGELDGSVKVSMAGGELEVAWPDQALPIVQSGLVELVFMGQWGFKNHQYDASGDFFRIEQ